MGWLVVLAWLSRLSAIISIFTCIRYRFTDNYYLQVIFNVTLWSYIGIKLIIIGIELKSQHLK